MERYKLVNDLPNHYLVLDNNQERVLYETTPEILLNEQYKKIQELEEQLRLSKLNESFEKERKINLLNNQKQLAIEELEKITTELFSTHTFGSPEYEQGFYSGINGVFQQINSRIYSLRKEIFGDKI